MGEGEAINAQIGGCMVLYGCEYIAPGPWLICRVGVNDSSSSSFYNIINVRWTHLTEKAHMLASFCSWVGCCVSESPTHVPLFICSFSCHSTPCLSSQNSQQGHITSMCPIMCSTHGHTFTPTNTYTKSESGRPSGTGQAAYIDHGLKFRTDHFKH